MGTGRGLLAAARRLAEMGERTYNPSVLLHNWFEDIALDQDVIKDFINRRERGELLMQKLGSFKDDLLSKTELAKSSDGYIHFGDPVLLINPGTEQSHSSTLHFPRAPMALTMNVDQSRFMTSKQVDSPCEVCGSRVIIPCIRNTFVITSVDGSCNGDPLRYGQSFALKTMDGIAGQLYLTSDMKLFLKFAKKSRMQLVNLVDQFSFLSCWQVLYLDPQMRLEYDGYPVQANVKVLVNHVRTNQALAVLQKHSFWTMFGREHEITTHTFLDTHRAEEDVNHWIMVTGDPSVPHGIMFHMPPPVCEDPEPKKKHSQESSDCFTQK
ncbi:cilia- and flagella-associated protein 161 isoform X1 [Pristis pectinata]|uniref:cilia- and flagella-associated protein 161 isoform X1 n=1 Tax=Pristis pectinata TaxID=685728 RepID=UPI00223CAC2F|nr:cilia- and flagella-associated protein 161 isoform X1 [Pristis pectinata]